MYVHVSICMCMTCVQPKQCHKDTRIRTKPLRDDLGASKDKNRRALDGCQCTWSRLRKAARGNCQGQEGLVPGRSHQKQQNLTDTRSLRALRDKDRSFLPNRTAWLREQSQEYPKRARWMQALECTRTESTHAESMVVLVKCFNRRSICLCSADVFVPLATPVQT